MGPFFIEICDFHHFRHFGIPGSRSVSSEVEVWSMWVGSVLPSFPSLWVLGGSICPGHLGSPNPSSWTLEIIPGVVFWVSGITNVRSMALHVIYMCVQQCANTEHSLVSELHSMSKHVIFGSQMTPPGTSIWPPRHQNDDFGIPG